MKDHHHLATTTEDHLLGSTTTVDPATHTMHHLARDTMIEIAATETITTTVDVVMTLHHHAGAVTIHHLLEGLLLLPEMLTLGMTDTRWLV